MRKLLWKDWKSTSVDVKIKLLFMLSQREVFFVEKLEYYSAKMTESTFCVHREALLLVTRKQ